MSIPLSIEDRTILVRLVADALTRYTYGQVEQAVRDAHYGKPDGVIVTKGNQHLFRRYRNTVSAVPSALLDEASFPIRPPAPKLQSKAHEIARHIVDYHKAGGTLSPLALSELLEELTGEKVMVRFPRGART